MKAIGPRSEPSSPVRRLDELEEKVAGIEYTGVVREQAERDPHEKLFKVVTTVTRLVESVVKPSDQFGSLDVGGILIAELTALHTGDEPERLDMLMKVGQREGNHIHLVRPDREARRSGSRLLGCTGDVPWRAARQNTHRLAHKPS